MTPTSNTGSKAALITWSVAATILFVAAVVWAIVSFVDATNFKKQNEALTQRYREVVDERDLQSPLVNSLEQARSAEGERFRGLGLLNVATRQRDDLQKLVAGAEGESEAGARNAAQTAVALARETTGDNSIPSDNLVAAIRGLSNRYQTVATERDRLLEQVRAADQRANTAIANADALTQQKLDEVAQANARAAQAMATGQADRDQQSQTFDATIGQINDEKLNIARDRDERSDQLNVVSRELTRARQENARLVSRLQTLRGPTDQILRHADGNIVRVTSGDRVLINLGRGNQITPGMTFEVFGQFGVPNVPADGDDMELQGKASIEVVRVLDGASEARVLRLSPGEAIAEGDFIVNLIYDKTISYKFYVFGNFDLDRSGDPGERDAQIIRRLVSQWGGAITDQINVDTDFVVLGNEPMIPDFTPDEIAMDPVKEFQMQQATAALDAYNDIRSRAISLNIPVLNQNRFLHLVGYYDEATR
jgi:hypothetical protein